MNSDVSIRSEFGTHESQAFRLHLSHTLQDSSDTFCKDRFVRTAYTIPC